MKKVIIISIIFLFLLSIVPFFIGISIKDSRQMKGFPLEKKEWPVRVTMYNTDPKQTDNTPNITASGFVIDSLNPAKHRIIAVSHDLKKHFKYGEKVLLEGVGKWSGIYFVRDLMNQRWRNKVDILINTDQDPVSFKYAKLIKLK